MKFSQIQVAVNGANQTFLPYDRGANGAFVWRKDGVTVNAPRVVASATTKDDASDRFNMQVNVPRVCESDNECGVDKILGTDLVKTEMRFLASTSTADRQAQIDTHIALLQELRDLIETRAVIYS